MPTLLSRWVENLARGSRSPYRARKTIGRNATRRWLPRFESLEDRVTPTTFVVTDYHDIAGSASDVTLRYALANAQNGDQITFSSSLSGDTIALASPLTIGTNVTITGLGASSLAVSGNNSVRDFTVNSGVTASITNLTIENARVGGSAAGIHNLGTLTLSNDIISGNSAGHSGGGICNQGTLTISNSTLSNNTAATGGGGCQNYGTLTLSNDTLSGNNGGTNGGGISNAGALSISGSTLSGNTAQAGGAIANYTSSGELLTINETTIASNTANNSGGGIWSQATLTLSQSTLSGNSAPRGGGVYTSGGTLTSIDSIFAGNTGTTGPDLDKTGGTVTASYTMIGNSSGSGITSGSGNILNPSSTGLATSLANNGGPTQTLALQSGSPAIAAGGALTTVSSDSGGSTITVANAAFIANVPGTEVIQIGNEQMLVTGISGNTLSVTRGYNGTLQTTHSSGASVFLAQDERGYTINTSTTTPDLGAYQSQGQFAVPVSNSTFSSPSIGANGNFDEYTLPTSWTDSYNEGITTSASPYLDGIAIPDGAQAAFTKGTGSYLGQNISFPSNGTYTISFYAVARPGYYTPFTVAVDGTVLATITPSQSNFVNYTETLNLTAGTHSLVFANVNSGDCSVNFNDITITGTTSSGSSSTNDVLTGGLDFRTVGGSFTQSGSTYSTTAEVEVGYIATGSQTFTPLLELNGTTTINTSTLTFSSTGTLSAIISGTSIPLLNGVSSVSLSSLTGTGLASLVGTNFNVAGVSFTLNTLALSQTGASGSPEVQLQGSLALPGGLTLAVNGSNYVNISSTGVSLTGVIASLSGSFSEGGVTFTASQLTAGYTAANSVFTITGNASATVSGIANLNIDLGGGSTSGLVITNGSLTSLNATVTGSFTVGGVSITASSLQFIDTVSGSSNTFSMAGTASVAVTNMGSFSVTLGNGSTPGLVLNNGSLTSLDLTVNGGITVGGVTITPTNLQFEDAVSSGTSTFSMVGTGSVAVTNMGSFSVTFGNGSTPGLVLSNGSLTSLDLTVNGGITVGGVTITPTNLQFKDTVSSGTSTFNMAGTATVAVTNLGTLSVTFGNGSTPGLVLTGGSLTSLDMTVNGNLSVGGVTITPTNLQFEDTVTSGTSTFSMVGTGSVAVPNMGSFSVTFGNGSTPGLVLTGGSLNSLDMTVNGNLSVGGVTITPINLQFKDTVNSGISTFNMAGTASVAVTNLGTLSVTFGNTTSGVTTPGLVLTSGSLTSLDMTVNGNLSVGGVTITPSNLQFKDTVASGTSTFNMAGTASVAVTNLGTLSVTFGNGSTPGLVLTSGSLTSLDMTVNGNLSVGGVTITPTNLQFEDTVNSGTSTFNMAGTASVVVTNLGTLSVTFGNTTSGVTTPGLVLTNGSLNSLDMTVNGNISVGGVTFAPTNLQFKDSLSGSNSTFNMAGTATATVPTLGNLSVTFGNTTNGVTTPGLLLTNGSLNSLDMTVTSNIVVGGVTITATDLQFEDTVSSGRSTFNLVGTASATITSLGTLSVTFGNTSNGVTTPGLVLTTTNGVTSLNSLDMTVNGNFTVGGVTISATNLQFEDAVSSGVSTFSMTGTGSVAVTNLGSFTVSFVNGGLVITNGSLTSLDMSVTSNFTVGSVTFGTNSLQFAYTAQNQAFQMTGSAYVNVSGMGSFNVTFANNGLVISNGALVSLDVSVTSSFTVSSVTFGTNGLQFAYTVQSHSFQLTGSAFVNVSGMGSFSVTFANNGLVISNGALVSLDVSVTSSFEVSDVTFGTDGLQFLYVAASQTYQLTGSAFVTVGGMDNMTVTFANNGLLISNGSLVSLDVSVTSSFQVDAVTFGTNGLQFLYVANTRTFQLTGSAFVTIAGGLSQLTVNFANNGLLISNGSLVSLDVSVTSSFTVDGVTFGTNGLQFLYVAQSQTFEMTGSTYVSIAGGLDQLSVSFIGNGLYLQHGSLVSLDLSVNSSFTVDGITFGVQNMVFYYMASSNKFGLYGTAYVNAFAGLGNVTVDFGGDGGYGIVVTNGQLTSLDMSVNGEFGVSSLDFTPVSNELKMTYQSSTGVFTMTGDATVSLPDIGSVSVDLGGSGTQGLVITNGSLTSLNMTVTAEFGVSSLDFTPVSGQMVLTYQSSTNTFTMTGNSSLNLPGVGSATVTFGGTPSNQSFNVYPADPDFQEPTQNSNAFTYNASGSPWSFNGSSGVATNGSGFNPPTAPQGNQVAFLQAYGTITQSAAFPAGTYTMSFVSAQRGGNHQNFQVKIDGNLVGIFTPSSNSFASYTTGSFTLSAGTHTIQFVGLDSTGGDNTAFLSEVSFSGSNPTLSYLYPNDPSFSLPFTEATSGGGYAYVPSSTPWTFSGSSGVANNGSAFGNANAPQGSQVAFLQNTGSVSQNVNFPSNGSYTVSLSAAQRPNDHQNFRVEIDGNVIGTFTPSSSNFATFTTSSFSETAGTHTVTIQGVDSVGGDNTAFIDQVSLKYGNTTFTPSDPGFELPTLGGGTYAYYPSATPWTFSGTGGAGSGVAGNGSGFNNINAPQGNSQVAFLQKSSSISQSLYFPGGTYTINFSAVQRLSENQNIEVEVDGNPVGTFTPSIGSFTTYSTNSFTVAAGNHTIKFLGLDSAGGDNTAFIDQVSISYPTTAYGLVITNGQLISLNATVNANFSIGPIGLTGNLAMSYNASTGTFVMTGDANASLLGRVSTTVDLGGANTAGLVITNGVLENLNFTISSIPNFLGIFGADLSASVSYTASSGQLIISGTAGVYFNASALGSWYSSFLPSGNLGQCGFYLKCIPNDPTDSYVDIYANFAGDTVGITVNFNGTVSIAAGDPLNVAIQEIAYNASLAYTKTASALASAYETASNGAVGVYNVTASQLTSAVNSAGNAITSVGNKISSGLSSAGHTISSWFGPLSGATIYYDPNDNLDFADDSYAVTASDGSLDYSLLNIPDGATTGQLVVVGGTDESTGLSNQGILTAPLGYLSISPLTTIINDMMQQAGLSEGTAVLEFQSALGISTSIDPLDDNYIKQGLAGDPVAASVFATEVQITALSYQIDAMLSAAGGGTAPSISTQFFDNVAAAISSTGGATLDLTDPTVVQSLLQATASSVGVTIDTTFTTGYSVSSGASTIMADVNQYIADLTPAGSSTYMNEVVQAQVVAENTITPLLAQVVAGTADINDVVAAETGTALSAQIQTATIGTLDLDGPTIGIANLVQQSVGYGDPTTFQIPVYLTTTSSLNETVSVAYTTEDGTATAANGDYTPVSGTLTWQPGNTSPQYITVPVSATSTIAADKLFEIILSNPVNATITSAAGVADIQGTDFATGTTLMTSTANSLPGQSVTLTATVTSPDANLDTETSSVTFYNGTTDLGTVSLVDGVATLSTTSLGNGLNTITATYSGWKVLGANYKSSTSASVGVTVAPAPQTIDFEPLGEVTYGNGPIALSATASTGEEVSYSIVSGPGTISNGTLTITGAGSIVVQASVPGDADDAPASAEQTLTVDPAVLTYTIDPQSMTYGGTMPTLTGSFSGFIAGEDSSVIEAQPTLSTVAATSGVGSYAITASGAVAANYTITYVTGTLTISPAPLTISADDQTTTYGSALPTLTATYIGLVNGDTPASLSTAPTLTADPTYSTGVGSYTITPSGAVDPNYLITYDTGTLTVNPYTLNYTIGNASQTVGSPVDLATALGTTIPGVNGDTLDITYSSAGDSGSAAPGTYAITGSVSDGTGSLSNYIVNLTNGTLNVGYTIQGSIFEDTNGSGADAPTSQNGLPGWTVFLDLNNDGTLDAGDPSTTTAANGSYSFTGLTQNSYTVDEVLPSGWVSTFPGNGPSTQVVYGGTTSGIDFGNFKLGTVSGTVYLDANGDGTFDNADSSQAGWVITLHSVSGTTPDQTFTTGSTGAYSFSNLAAGTYTLTETMKPGYQQTQPSSANSFEYTFTVSSEFAATSDNFGNAVFAAPSHLAISPDTGTSQTDGITATGTINFLGTVSQSGETVQLTDLTTNTNLGLYTVSGTSFSIPLSLSQGIHDIQAQAFDSLGDSSQTSTFNVVVDATAPSSHVNALPTTQTSDTFTVPVSFSEAAGSYSGVASVDLYVSTNGGATYTLYATMSANGAASGTLNFSFTGVDRTIYSFHSIAHSVAGLTESKASTTIEASTYVPNLTPPVSHVVSSSPAYTWGPFPASIFSSVAASSYSNGTFTINFAGADPDQPEGGSIHSLSVYVKVDGGSAALVGTLTTGNPTAVSSGGTTYYVYSGSMIYSALADGNPHTYSFYSIATDDQSLTQAVPATADATFSNVSYSAALTASLVVEKGIAERSYIRYLDVYFNQPSTNPAMEQLAAGVAGSSLSSYVQLLWYGESLTSSSVSKGSVNISGRVTFTSSSTGSELSIDFGTAGITSLLTETGVSGTGTAATAFGDGWFALGIDPNANPSLHQVFWEPFFRLLGDVNGGGTVTGPVATAGTDLYVVNAARGTSGTLLNADVNGDGSVNTTDLSLVNTAYNLNSHNNTVGSIAPQNFPQFQLLSGNSGSGKAEPITLSQVDALLPTALNAWKGAGLNAAGLNLLEKVQIEVGNLGSNILGLENPGTIEINATAAGYNWYIGGEAAGTPGTPVYSGVGPGSEQIASASSPAAGQVDLLTVLEHELGHVIGLADNATAGDLMDISLGLGTRRSPSAADLADVSKSLKQANQIGDLLTEKSSSVASPGKRNIAIVENSSTKVANSSNPLDELWANNWAVPIVDNDRIATNRPAILDQKTAANSAIDLSGNSSIDDSIDISPLERWLNPASWKARLKV